MHDDLYFLPPLWGALDEPDLPAGLRRAFAAIAAQGREPRYARGYAQFLAFLRASTAYVHEEDASSGPTEPTPEDLALVWDPGSPPDDPVLDVIRFDPNSLVKVQLQREGLELDTRLLLRGSPAVFRDLTPGPYRLSLETGRVVWEAALDARDLRLVLAFPEAPLDAAADTAGGEERPTRYDRQLDGEIEVRVFPGRKAGRLEVAWCVM